MSSVLTWNSDCFSINGKPAPLISGEFHYFRVPKKDWEKRLLLLKESGGNAVATYIPWIIHEPAEGTILFDDIPERSLSDFLTLCCQLDLMVIARPGPYCYSELRNGGVPDWLQSGYPSILACDAGGTREAISYMHPLFLQKARRYFKAVADVIKPFLVTNGGCIVSIQVDNEIGGFHLWSGYMDCNREGMGIGSEDGYYVRFLAQKYGTIQCLNERYETSYNSFLEVDPFHNTPTEQTLGGKRFITDYRNFYRHIMELYIQTLCGWLEEDDLHVDVCVNAGNAGMTPLMRNIPRQNKKHSMLLGVDHYYTLGPSMGISMTPEKAMLYLYSMDMLSELGMPPSVLEMQSGSASCYPPILPDNLYGFYMTFVAYGMKGCNYYIFTGGPNFADTGSNTEIYDYHAPVSATGEIRPIYDVQKARNEFSLKQEWLLHAERCCDIQFGFYWDMAQDISRSAWNRYSRDGLNMKQYCASLQLTLGMSARLLRFREIGEKLNPSIPLVLPCDQRMSERNQEALIAFVKAGGKLILTPVIPEFDEDFMPCTLLRDFLGVGSVKLLSSSSPIVLKTGEKVFDTQKRFQFTGFDGSTLAYDEASGIPVIQHKQLGDGQVILLGAAYDYNQFCQMDMLELCLEALGAERLVHTDSKELMVTLFQHQDQAMCFLINHLAGTVRADLTVRANGKCFELKKQTVPSQSVLPIELK